MTPRVKRIASNLLKQAGAPPRGGVESATDLQPIKEFGVSPQEGSLVKEHTSPLDEAIPNHGIDSPAPAHTVKNEGDVTTPLTDKPKSNAGTSDLEPSNILDVLGGQGINLAAISGAPKGGATNG